MKKILLALMLCFSIAASAQTCTLKRNSSGNIARSTAQVNAFKRANTCPSTGVKSTAKCPGYQVEHTIPLCACGPDNLSNMTWMAIAEHRVKTKVDVKNCTALKKSGAVK